MKNIFKFIKHNLIFILLFVLALSLEIGIFNNVFFTNTFKGLHETNLNIVDGSLKDFSFTNGSLISKSEDPNITFKQLNQRIKYLSIDCVNTHPDAFGQVYYKHEGQGFSEAKSEIFPLSENDTIISFPNTLKIDSLRFDLTNKQGDILVCKEIKINPETDYSPHYLSLIFLVISVSGLFFSKKILPESFSLILWDNLIKNGLLFFILLIIIFDFAYPPTITYDSAQYLFLSDLLKTGNWLDWDPLRNPVFPLKILVSLSIFGYQPDALLIPMIIAHLLLFLFSYLILIEVIKPKSQFQNTLLASLVFFIVALDPTIFGYFHVLLTEYVVATIAVISCYLAVRIYKTNLFSIAFYIYSALLIILAPLTWHIKQPYIGAALFPMIVVSLLIIIRKFSWKTFLFSILSISVAGILVFSSNILWRNFMEKNINSLREDRFISNQLGTSVDRKMSDLREQPIEFAKDIISDYFTSINFKTRNSAHEETQYSLTYGFQNDLISHRMYLFPGEVNIIYDHQPFDSYTRYYFDHYSPPNTLNGAFLVRLNLSHFLFTMTSLLLPLVVPILFFFWLSRKRSIPSALIILGATSLFNALGHLIIWPIDRYLFLGYPLNLLILVIILFEGGKFIHTSFSPQRFSLPESITNERQKQPD